MARNKKGEGGASTKPKTTAEALSDDQRYSLVEEHRQTYERLLAAKKTADNALKNHGKVIKADLGKHGMSQVQALIEASTPEGEAAVKERIRRDAEVLRWLGVPIGTQTDMFPVDRTPAVERAYAEGKRQGLAGESCNNPHHHATEAHREHNRGYEDGQETMARNGFKKLDDTPKGSVPREEWQRQTAADNEAVSEAIKSGTVHQLGTREPTHTVTQ
jgi:hypothetical protein